MLKSLPAKIKAEDELVKEVALIVKVSPDCRVPELLVVPLVVLVNVPVARMFLALLKEERLSARFPFD